jgi:hypothetical protein
MSLDVRLHHAARDNRAGQTGTQEILVLVDSIAATITRQHEAHCRGIFLDLHGLPQKVLDELDEVSGMLYKGQQLAHNRNHPQLEHRVVM